MTAMISGEVQSTVEDDLQSTNKANDTNDYQKINIERIDDHLCEKAAVSYQKWRWKLSTGTLLIGLNGPVC